jgi:hypothetical protein
MTQQETNVPVRDTAATETQGKVNLQDYKVIPKHVGNWEGTVRFLDADLQLTKSYGIKQTFQDAGEKWIITNTYLYPDGTSFSHSFDVIPIGNSEVNVEPQDGSAFSDSKLTAVEHGDIVDFKVFNTATGLLREIETIVLQGENKRVRTTQFFTDNGDLKSLLVVVEHRVD